MIREVEFSPGKKGFLAEPGDSGRHPAVIQLHERYGIVEHTTDIAERIAGNGYVVLAPDMFSRFTGDREALGRGDISVGIRDDEALADLDEAIRYVRNLDSADGDHLALMGVCQTGRQPLLAAAHRKDIASALVLYGGIYQRDWEPHEERPEPVGHMIPNLCCPVLGLFGERDHIISIDDVRRFREHLETAGKSYRMRIFRDAPHGWLNDTMPGRYRPEASEAAWAMLLAFLNDTLNHIWDRSRVTWDFEGDRAEDYDFTKMERLA